MSKSGGLLSAMAGKFPAVAVLVCCPKCGHRLGAEAVVCSDCGHEVMWSFDDLVVAVLLNYTAFRDEENDG